MVDRESVNGKSIKTNAGVMGLSVEKKSTTMIDNVRTEPPTKKSRLLRELEDSDGFTTAAELRELENSDGSTTAADRNKQGQSSGHRRKLPTTSVDNSYHQTNTL